MDDAALIGFVGALAGAMVGAIGTYWATVGAARRQGRDRTRAVLGAVRAYLQDEEADGGGASARVQATFGSIQELRALLRTATASPPPPDADLDQPMHHRLVLSFPTLTQPVWSGMLASEVGFVPPQVYLKLSELEVLASHINDTTKQCLDPALNLHRLLRTLPQEVTLRQVAVAPQRPELEAVLEKATVFLEILLDLYIQRRQLRQELQRLLPA